MTREDMIQELRRIAPIITEVTGTCDMGCEFSAIVPNGVIYSEPGMLLNYSGGEWPPSDWSDVPINKRKELLHSFLLDETWEVNAFEDLSDEEIEQWLEDARSAEDNKDLWQQEES